MTTGTVTTATGAAGEQSANAAAGWEAIRADGSIQYAPVKMPEKIPPQQPEWLKQFLEWLHDTLAPLGEAIGLSWPVLRWILLGIAIALVLFVLWRLLAPVLERGPRRKQAAVEESWAPQREEALALLDDADRLAGEGRYDEATHLLLKRSVSQIASARPEWVEVSSTARELAALPALPETARHAFRIIAERVERSLFALTRLGVEDWEAARAAYAEFALQRIPQGQA